MLEITRGEKGIVFVSVPGQIGIRGNSAADADSTAKDVLHGDLLDEHIPFSDLKSRLNKCLFRAVSAGVGRLSYHLLHNYHSETEWLCFLSPC